MASETTPLTWQEVEEYGQAVSRLSEGSQFVTVLSGPDGFGFKEYVGEVVHKGVGSVTVQVAGYAKDENIHWCPDTKVIPV